ncbi:MAG TPA: protease pro-enzyme activation domain-containing protein [Acidimicrobiales bacterium]
MTLMSLAPIVVASGADATPAMVRVSGLAPLAAPRDAIPTGPTPSTQAIGLEVVLAPSHPAELSSLVRSLYDVRSPLYHHWLTPREFAQRFDPTPSAISQVEAWLSSVGLHSTYQSGFSVQVSGSTGGVESGLGVAFHEYRLASGAQVHVADRAPLLPTTLSATVISVLGLDSAPRLVSHLVPSHAAQSGRVVPHADGLSPCVAATSAAGANFFTPDQVGAAYGVGTLLRAGQTGAGQTVAVYELGQHQSTDTSGYETCFGLHNPITTIPVDSGGTAGAGGQAEADADIEQVATQAPGASILSYEGPNTGLGAYDTWNAIISQDTASVVSTSYGLCEPGNSGAAVTLEDTLFVQAAAQGQTILAASGDSGSEDCYPGTSDTSLQVDYPASDPYVTAVGGTTLSPNGTQVAWNDCQGQTGAGCANTAGKGSGGGGVSRISVRPTWQPAEWEWSGPANPCGTNCRDVPDVSANSGTPEVFFVQGTWGAFVGTSIASPLIAGIVSDIGNGCSSGGRGDISQALYGLAGQGVYGTALSDVATGDNDLTRTYTPAEYPSVAGYDPATGLGTPIAGGWSCPEVTSVSPAEAVPGTEATIGGLGLEKATISFGGSAAQVVSATATSATVVVPAGSGTVSVSATSLMGAGTSTGLFRFTPSSTPPPAPPPSRSGYDLVGQDGGVFVFPTDQSSGFFGSLPGLGIHVNDIAGMVPSPDDKGYFLVGQDGGVFSFGDAPFLGSLPGLHVAVHDIRGIIPTRDNRGYFLVGQDGGVFAFGDAPFLGSLPGQGIHIADVIGIAATPSDQGYWVVAGNGTVYAFGNAPNFGSATGSTSPVSGIAATPDGGGYWIVTQNGSVRQFGDAGYFLSLPALGVSPTSPVIGLVPTADDLGYWLIGSDGGIFAFGDAPFVGSLPGLGLRVTDVVGAVPTTF